MKKIYIIIPMMICGLLGWSQSFHTINFSGNSSDYNAVELVTAANAPDIAYGLSYDENFLYVSVYRNGSDFNGQDALTFFIDTDADINSAQGTTAGNPFDNVTPSFSYNVDYAVRVRGNTLGNSYSELRSWNETNSSWDFVFQNSVNTFYGNRVRSIRISKQDLGNPEFIRINLWMGYNDNGFSGIFATAPAAVNDSQSPLFSNHFGTVAVNRSGSNITAVVDTNGLVMSYGSSSTIPAGTYTSLALNGFPTAGADITIAPGGTLAITGISIINLGANNLTFGNWAGMTVDVAAPATINSTGTLNFTNGGISRTNNTNGVSLTINPELIVNGDFYANSPLIRNSITFNANAINRLPLRYFQNSRLIYRSNLMTTTGAEWGTGSIVSLNGVPDNVIVDQPLLRFDTNKNLFGYIQVDSGNLDLNGFDLILKSDTARTAAIGPINTAAGASVTGNTVVARRIIPRRADGNPAFRFLASPVNGQTIYQSIQANGANPIAVGTQVTGGTAANGFDQSSTNNPSMFRYLNNPAMGNPRWESVANTNMTNFEVGVPFRTFIRGDRGISLTMANQPANNTTLIAKGSIVQGNVTYDSASTVNALNNTPGNFNMIANPYAAFTDMSQVLDQSTDVNPNFYYTWDPRVNTRGAYVTVSLSTTDPAVNGTNNVMSSNADQFLEPWQSCFIVNDAAAANVSVLFTETAKTVETTATRVFNMPTALNRLALTLYNDQDVVLDGLLVDYNASFSNAIDGMDALKLGNLDENIGAFVGGNSYSILRNAMPLNDELLYLSIGNFRGTNYKLSMQRNGLNTYNITLVDTYLNVQHDLTQGDYVFTIDNTINASLAANRFYIKYTDVTLSVDDSASAKAITLYPNPVSNGILYFNNPTASSFNVALTNMIGQQVFTQNAVSNNQIDLSAMRSGYYLITITQDGSSKTEKIIIP